MAQRCSDFSPVDDEVLYRQLLKQVTLQRIAALQDIKKLEGFHTAILWRLREIAKQTVPKSRFGSPAQKVPQPLLDEAAALRQIRENILSRLREIGEKATKVA